MRMPRVFLAMAALALATSAVFAKQRVGVYECNGHCMAVDGEPVFAPGATRVHSWTPIS